MYNFIIIYIILLLHVLYHNNYCNYYYYNNTCIGDKPGPSVTLIRSKRKQEELLCNVASKKKEIIISRE